MTDAHAPVQSAATKRRTVLACLVAAALLGMLYLIWRFTMLEGSTVQIGQIPVNVGEEFASAPKVQRLVLAAAQGRTVEVERLVASGAEVNRPGDFYRLTPLMWAVMHGNVEGTRKLLTLGADPNIRVTRPTEEDIWRELGAQPTDRERRLQYGRARQRMDAFGGEPALGLALRKGRLDLMELLLQNGADPNIQGRIDPVMFDAIEATHGEVSPALRLLIKYGANPNLTAQPDGSGASAVDWFTFSGNMASAIYLIEQGADPTRTVRRGMLGVSLPREKLTEDNSVPWNQAAAIVQRFLPKNPKPDSRVLRLKQLMEQRGVRFPVYDPNRPATPEQERTMTTLEYLKHTNLPDHDIERTIAYHARNGTLRDLGTLAEDYERYRQAKAAGD